MLKVRVNFREIYIRPEETIRIEFPTDYFDLSSIPSARILPFSAPVDENEHVFEYMHLAFKKKEIKKLPCEILFFDIPFFSATLYLTKTSSKDYRMSIVVNSFTETFNTKLLTEFTFDPIVISATSPNHLAIVSHATQVANGTVEAPYRFPLVAAEKFYGSIDSTTYESEYNRTYGLQGDIEISGRFFNLINPVDFGYHRNSNNPDGSVVNEACLVPFFKLQWLAEQVFKSENYNVSGAFMQHEDIKKLLIMNNRTIDKKYSMLNVVAFRSVAALLQGNVPFTENITDTEGCYNAGTTIYTAQEPGFHEVSLVAECKFQDGHEPPETNFKVFFRVYKNNVQQQYVEFPMYPVDYEFIYTKVKFTKSVLCAAGDELRVTVNASYEIYEGGIWHTYEEQVWVKIGNIHYRNTSYSALNQYASSIFPEQHLPELEAGKFFTSLKQTFGLVYLFDIKRKIAEIDFFSNILKGNTLDITHMVIDDSFEEEYVEEKGFELKFAGSEAKSIDGYEFLGEFATWDDLPLTADMNQCGLVINQNAYFVYTYDEDDDFQILYWKYYTDRLQDLKTGAGETKLEPKLAPAAMTVMDRFLVPRFDGEASSPAFNMEIKPVDMRLLFYNGLFTITADQEYTYPFATSQKTDLKGETANNFSLQWEELYELFLKDQLAYMTNPIKASCNIHIEPEQIFELIKLVMPRVSNPANNRYVGIGNRKYLPEQINFVLKGDTIKDAEILMRRRVDEH